MDRLSKGSSVTESLIRRMRKHIESVYAEGHVSKKLSVILPLVERQMNLEPLSSLGGLSSTAALRHDARYVSMLKHSVRFRKRKYLKREMSMNRMLPMYSIVRLKSFAKKKVFNKESYGRLSTRMFIIVDRQINDFVTCFRLASLLSLEPISDITFTFHEVVLVPISYPLAVYKEILNNPGPIVRVDGDDIEFKPEHSKFTYIASKSMFL